MFASSESFFLSFFDGWGFSSFPTFHIMVYTSFLLSLIYHLARFWNGFGLGYGLKRFWLLIYILHCVPRSLPSVY